MTVLRDLLNQSAPRASAEVGGGFAMARMEPATLPMPTPPKLMDIPNASVGALQDVAPTTSTLSNLVLIAGIGAVAYYFGKRQGKGEAASASKSKLKDPIPGVPTVKVGARVAPALPEGSLKIKKAPAPKPLPSEVPVAGNYDFDDFEEDLYDY